jgi:hypothetical protein
MRALNFSLQNSSWSYTHSDTLAWAVFDNLIGQVTGNGFACVNERLESTAVRVQYEIVDQAVTAINYLGKLLDANGEYTGNECKGRRGLSSGDSDTTFKESNSSITIPIAPPTRSFKLRDLLPSLRARHSKVPQLHPESYYD